MLAFAPSFGARDRGANRGPSPCLIWFDDLLAAQNRSEGLSICRQVLQFMNY
jgi:hypothetical protein